MDEAVIQQIPAIVKKLRTTFETRKTVSIQWRKQQLQQLLTLCKYHRKEICEALSKDLGCLPEVANLNEVGATIQEIERALSSIDDWVKPVKKSVPVVVLPSRGYMVKEPYGVVCIISPWNYPFRLLFFPLIGAIAAGNAVLLKPSEVSSHTSAIMKRLLDLYLDKEAIATVEGGVSVSSAILAQKFDYIFYTGNTEVGRIVMKAAAENLTPVTLELGGKSPVYIDKSCNLDVTTNRILGGKFMNCGQTCVAPDYVLVDQEIKEKFIEMLKNKIVAWYGENPKNSLSYSRIINERHARRLESYLHESKEHIVFGGKTDPTSKYIDPTLVVDPKVDSKLMKEEIFGPILPILGVSSPKEAIDFINQRAKPLALYVFAQDGKVKDYVVSNTSSGGVCLNGTVYHIICPEMPFGGVGESGLGSYNGKTTFDTFSHEKAVLDRATWVDPQLLYPPFTEKKRGIMTKAADGVNFKLSTKAKVILGALVVGAVVAKSKL